MKKIKELLRLKKTWTILGCFLGVLGYSQYSPVADAVGDAISAPSSETVEGASNVATK